MHKRTDLHRPKSDFGHSYAGGKTANKLKRQEGERISIQEK